MKKLHFKFIDGENILIDRSVDFELKNEKYEFKIDDYHFTLELLPKLKMTREDVDSIFELTETSNSGSATYELKNPNLKVDIHLSHFKVIKSEKEYIIEYVIESDEENKKTICIAF